MAGRALCGLAAAAAPVHRRGARPRERRGLQALAAGGGDVVVIEGGGFVLPGWADVGTCRALARHGFGAVNISYPLHDLPGAVKTTMRKLRRERRHGLPVCALGESSGGRCAELAAVEGRVPAAVAVAAPSEPAGLVSGRRGVGAASGAAAAAYWRDVGATRRERRAASPGSRIGARPSPLLLFHSPEDEVVPIAQARSLAAAGAGRPVKPLRGRHLRSGVPQARVRVAAATAVDLLASGWKRPAFASLSICARRPPVVVAAEDPQPDQPARSRSSPRRLVSPVGRRSRRRCVRSASTSGRPMRARCSAAAVAQLAGLVGVDQRRLEHRLQRAQLALGRGARPARVRVAVPGAGEARQHVRPP